jgi:toxin ParE1/3/4
MPRVFKRAAARQDLIDHYVCLVGVAGEELADRFLVRAEQSFSDLAAQPEMGAPLVLRRPELVGLRK